MLIEQEFIHQFNGYGNSSSRCHIRVLNGKSHALVVLCSQVAGNSGTSVTNAAELIAQDVKKYLEKNNVTLAAAISQYIKTSRFTKMLDDLVRKLKDSKNLTIFTLESIKLALEYREQQKAQSELTSNLLWVEHYPPGLGLAARGSYALVTFEGEGWSPQWHYVSLQWLADHTGLPELAFSVKPDVLGA
jgi:hypothetical protein